MRISKKLSGLKFMRKAADKSNKIKPKKSNNPFSEFRFVFKGGGSNFRKLDTDYFDVIDINNKKDLSDMFQ